MDPSKETPDMVLTDALRRLARADVTHDISNGMSNVGEDEKKGLGDPEILRMCYERFGQQVSRLRKDIQSQGVDGSSLEKFDDQVLGKISYGGRTDTTNVVAAVNGMGLDAHTRQRMLAEHFVYKYLAGKLLTSEEDEILVRKEIGLGFEQAVLAATGKVEQVKLNGLAGALFDESTGSPSETVRAKASELRNKFAVQPVG
jgi:hypothetical protein